MFRGIFENNDPQQAADGDHQLQHRHFGVLGVLGTGLKPLEESNEAYKLGVNYVIYGMTH